MHTRADREGFDAHCEFCLIATGRDDAEVVFENDSVMAFFPINPATTGHTLVIPRQHYSNFLLLDSGSASTLFASAVGISRGIERALNPAGMNMIVSAGEAATQSVMHVHVHLVPRFLDDDLGEIWPPARPSSRKLLSDLGEAVRDAINDVDGNYG